MIALARKDERRPPVQLTGINAGGIRTSPSGVLKRQYVCVVSHERHARPPPRFASCPAGVGKDTQHALIAPVPSGPSEPPPQRCSATDRRNEGHVGGGGEAPGLGYQTVLWSQAIGGGTGVLPRLRSVRRRRTQRGPSCTGRRRWRRLCARRSGSCRCPTRPATTSRRSRRRRGRRRRGGLRFGRPWRAPRRCGRTPGGSVPHTRRSPPGRRGRGRSWVALRRPRALCSRPAGAPQRRRPRAPCRLGRRRRL